MHGWHVIVMLTLVALGGAPPVQGQTMVGMENDSFTVSTPTHEGAAGPQEFVDFRLRIENHRDTDVRFEFSLPYETEERMRGYHVVLPEPLEMPAGGDVVVIVQVYTPFHNGYVDDDLAFMLRVQSMLVEDPGTMGDFTEFGLLVRTNGWYVPGPGTAIVALALLAAPAWTSKRRAT